MAVRAQAQPAPEPAPAPPPVEATVPPSEPVPPPPPVAAEPPPAAPAVEDPTKKALTINAWARVDARLYGDEDPKDLNRLGMNGVFELHTDGAITDQIGLTANVIAGFGNDTISGNAGLLDLIGRFDICEAFHVWAGRMLVPSDRANFSGDWFASPWYYAGSFALGATGVMGGPAQGPNGRNDGLTVWGQFAGGLFKYYLGSFDLYSTTNSPLWSGRLNLSLINPEPGYYHSSVYYGAKDILAIGIGGQIQKNGSVGPRPPTPAATPAMPMPVAPPAPTDDYAEFNADILFEKNFKAGGVLDLEGAFYKYAGDYSLDYSYLLLASWLTPDKVGPGKIQPLVRFQQLKPQAGETATAVEAQVGYVIADYSARLALGYQYTKINDQSGNALYLGAQFMK